MEPTEAQIEAAAQALYVMNAADDYTIGDARIDAGVAVRAAFAAVPDPTELADKWDREAQDYGQDPDEIHWMMEHARQLRAFMREGAK